jgi:uncharacterized protein (TIGR03086 family)
MGTARTLRQLVLTYRRRADAFAALIAETPAERWDAPSPCDGWRARDVVAHVVDYSAEVLRDKAHVQLAPPPGAQHDQGMAFGWIRREVERVLEDPATPPDVVRFIDEAVSFDLPQHWWDLAVATGQDATIDPVDVEIMWSALSPASPAFWKWQVDNGYYAPAVPVAQDAPLQDRLLGLIGRDPHWTAPA